MIHFIATDAHSSTRRRPIIRETYDYIVRKYGEQKAEILFIQNPYKVIEDKEIYNFHYINSSVGLEGIVITKK